MRTTIWQIVKLAIMLTLHPGRKDLRIGQILLDTCNNTVLYNIENDDLARRIYARIEG